MKYEGEGIRMSTVTSGDPTSRYAALLIILGIAASLALLSGCAGGNSTTTVPSSAAAAITATSGGTAKTTQDSTTTGTTWGAAGQVAKVTIEDGAFVPDTVTIQAGDSVTWLNHEDTPHDIIVDGGTLSTVAFGRDSSFTFRFTAGGTFHYHCSQHPQMKGTVVVR
jgi:plastocyanin